MSSNFVRFQEILNQAFAENFTCLTKKLANPLKNLALHFLLIGIPFVNKIVKTCDEPFCELKIISLFASMISKYTCIKMKLFTYLKNARIVVQD